MNLICFKVGTTVYGINMTSVLKLAQFDQNHLESLPNAKSHVLGAIEYEGNPICTYDVGEFLKEGTGDASRSVVVFLSNDADDEDLACIAGIKMDDLQGVENDIDPDAIREVVGDNKQNNRTYIRGMVKGSAGEIVVVGTMELVDALQK